MTSPLRVHAALFTVALLFSANYIVSKLGMREFAPLSFAWLRVFGSALAMWLIARNEPPLGRDDARRVALYAILGVNTLGLAVTQYGIAPDWLVLYPLVVLLPVREDASHMV